MHELKPTKSLAELRISVYHQQLGRKMCAAYIAQQQGISLGTAMKKVAEPVGDLWLAVAEFARRGYAAVADKDVDAMLRPDTGHVM
jgi:hypothetical protein